MSRLCGIGLFAVLVAFLASATLAQTPPAGRDGKSVDQPVTKATGVDGDDETEEDGLPDPPPFFGEDGAAGEKMKIVFCIDRSGSMILPAGQFRGPDGAPMSGSRWDRARVETTISLSQLTPEWDFGIVTYSCTRDRYKDSLVPAAPEEVANAVAWVNGHRPNGGTGTGPAQAEAFRLADGGIEGSATCWLVSDGRPNCGANGTTGHKMVALSANAQCHVLNTIGIADTGVFAAFMKELAEATGGKYFHVE